MFKYLPWFVRRLYESSLFTNAGMVVGVFPTSSLSPFSPFGNSSLIDCWRLRFRWGRVSKNLKTVFFNISFLNFEKSFCEKFQLEIFDTKNKILEISTKRFFSKNSKLKQNAFFCKKSFFFNFWYHKILEISTNKIFFW